MSRAFGEEAFKLVGDIAQKNGWAEGSPQKIALHALVGGIMADMGGSDALSGATGAGLNEAIQKELAKIEDPGLHEWASLLVGGAAAQIVGGNAQTGGSTATSGTRNNYLTHLQYQQMLEELTQCETDEERNAVKEKWERISEEQDRAINYDQVEDETFLGYETDGTPVFVLKVTGNKNNSEYLGKTLRQILLGNYTNDATLLGTGGQIGLGVLGLDLLGDIRDLTYDATNWEWTPGHVGQTLVDGISLAPGIGVIKYLKKVEKLREEAKDLAKTGEKIEESADVVKGPSKAVDFTFDPKKIGKQMDKRGWTEDSIKDTLNDPVKTVKTQDTRWLPGAEKPLNDPATAYYAKDGSYVVRNDKTGEITQISNKNDPNWIAPWDTK